MSPSLSCRQCANELSRSVVRTLNREVIPELIDDPRYRNGIINEEKAQQVAKKKIIDGRSSAWMSTSGKGGSRYATEYRNVSLIDHCISVASGAVAFCALAEIHQGADPDDEGFQRELFTIGLTGLLHDLNKLVSKDKTSDPAVFDEIQHLLQNPKIEQAIAKHGIPLDAPLLFSLISLVEAGTAMEGADQVQIPNQLKNNVRRYVRLADRLDGAYQKLGPTGGVQGVLTELAAWDGDLPNFLLEWQHLSLFDPSHPYLLDKLLQQLSLQCRNVSGLSPMLEVHHDGQIDLLLPSHGYDRIVEDALNTLQNQLRTGYEITLSTTKKPDIMGGKPTAKQLLEDLRDNHGKVAELLTIGRADLEFFIQIPTGNELLLQFGEAAQKKNGATLMPLAVKEPDRIVTMLSYAAFTILVVEHTSQIKGIKIPSPAERWTSLLAASRLCLDDEPRFSSKLSEPVYRVLKIVSAAAADPELFEHLYGDNGLIKQFYDGFTDDEGCHQFGVVDGLLGDKDDELLGVVISRYRALLANEVIADKTPGVFSSAQGCLITGEPGKGRIEAKDGLYGVKVSQFSTRRGRPARLGDSKGQTHLSPTSFVEFKLRTQHHGNSDKFPVVISSPTISGLFAELRLDDEEYVTYGLYDLVRENLSKGSSVLHGVEIFQRRSYLARQELWPTKLDEQIDWLKRLVKSVLRTGRPFHIFLGGIQARPEIFYIDCLPSVLKNLLGGKSGFRLEELQQVQTNLELAAAILSTKGMGCSLLNSMISPTLKYGAYCQAFIQLNDHITELHKHNQAQELPRLRSIVPLLKEQLDNLRETMSISTRDSRIMELAQQAAGLQRVYFSNDSRNKQLLLLKLIMNAARDAVRCGYTTENGLSSIIADQLERKLAGSKYAGAREHRGGISLIDGCVAISDYFVKQIWFPLFNEKFPSRREMALISGIYRFEMLKVYQTRRIETENEIEID